MAPEDNPGDDLPAGRKARAIATLILACEFAVEVFGKEGGPGTIVDDVFAERLEAVCQLTHAIAEAREAFA